MQNTQNLVPLILSGPSGIGKSFIEKYLCSNYNLQRLISTTTRPQRPGEIDGEDYYFVTEYEYKEREKENRFITSVFNLNAWYGFEKSQVEQIQQKNKIPITICVPQIIDQFIAAYPDTKAFYLVPDSFELLEKRMRQRGDTPEKIQYRLKYAHEEIAEYQHKKHYYQEEIIVTAENFQEIVKRLLFYYTNHA